MPPHTDPSVANEIEKLQRELAVYKETTAIAIASLQKQLDQAKALAALELEVKTQLGQIKWIGAATTVTIAIAGTALGIFGYRSADDYINTVKKEFNSRLDRIGAFYYDFSKGNALLGSDKSAEAVPYLRRCWDQNYYDESVLVPFLEAVEWARDLRQGSEVIQKLQSDPAKFGGLKNPSTHLTIGLLQLEIALDRGQPPDQAIQSIQVAQRLTPNDDYETQKMIFIYFWLCQMARRDTTQAQHMIDILTAFPVTVKVDNWDSVKSWHVYGDLMKRFPDMGPRAEALWSQLKNRYY
jgi:hypothetical protein